MNRPLAPLVALALATALFASPASAQYALRATAVASGATDAAGGAYRLRATVGQPASGRVTGASYALGQGFWYPATAGGGPPGPALSVTATPLNPPIVIPAAGGMFRFRVTIQNNTAQTQTFQAWINATLPNGSTYHVQGPQSLTLGPNATFGPVTLQQQIPDWAPAGTYAHNVHVGTYPNGAVATGSFPWTKAGAAAVADDDALALGARAADAERREAAAATREAGAPNTNMARRAAGRTAGRTAGRAAAREEGPGARRAAARQPGWLLLLDATGEPVGEGPDLALAMPIDEAAEARITAEEEALAVAREAAEEGTGWEAGTEAEAADPEAAGPGRPGAAAPPAAFVAPPAVVTLAPAFPNPGSRTTLRFGLPEAGGVRLAVYDVQGRRVALLVDEARGAGWHEAPFGGAGLAAGVYLARLEADGHVLTQRFTLLR